MKNKIVVSTTLAVLLASSAALQAVALSIGSLAANDDAHTVNFIEVWLTDLAGTKTSRVIFDDPFLVTRFNPGTVKCWDFPLQATVDKIIVDYVAPPVIAYGQTMTYGDPITGSKAYAEVEVGVSECDLPSACATADAIAGRCKRSPKGRAVHFNITSDGPNGQNQIGFTGSQYCGFNGC